MNPRTQRLLLSGLALLSLFYLVGYLGFWRWSVCRYNVPPGHSLLLYYKGPFPFGAAEQAPEGTLVQLDRRGRPEKVGILEAMPGPGRHFYSPLEYERTLVPDVVIEPGKLGVLTSKVGKPLPAGTFLADAPGFRGIWRRVLTPGRYRINTYAYDVKVVDVNACVRSAEGVRHREGDATLIPPGYVGVVTNLAGDARHGQGIQEDILQPGLYFLNPEEKRIDILSIGYNETTLEVEPVRDAQGRLVYRRVRNPIDGKEITSPDPEYVAGQGIEFPSSDGFPIHMDYTAIWGIMPDQAPSVVRNFGTIKDVEQKVVLPQIGSICRLHGSKRGAVDLLVGDTRESFQTDTAEELERVLTEKDLTLLFGLTRHIYVPSQVREPLQRAKIADELKLTRDQEQLTAKAQADLTESKAKVVLEERRTKAETGKLVAQVAAEGEKQAREIEATTEKLRAEIDAKTALVQAQITTVLGQAEAEKVQLANEAEAERYRQYVRTLGGADAYNRFVFAEGLPVDLKLGVFYAGPGTFWTDLKGFQETLLGKMASEANARQAPPTPIGARPAPEAGRR